MIRGAASDVGFVASVLCSAGGYQCFDQAQGGMVLVEQSACDRPVLAEVSSEPSCPLKSSVEHPGVCVMSAAHLMVVKSAGGCLNLE